VFFNDFCVEGRMTHIRPAGMLFFESHGPFHVLNAHRTQFNSSLIESWRPNTQQTQAWSGTGL